MKTKFIYLILTFICSISYSQQQFRPENSLRVGSVFLNYTNSIFNKPIEEFKYVSTPQGIQIYETYRHPTNGYINQTIFPKALPVAVIKTNSVNNNIVIYKNYSNSMFNRAIEFSTIRQPRSYQPQKNKPYISKNLPRYNGEGEVSYGE